MRAISFNGVCIKLFFASLFLCAAAGLGAAESDPAVLAVDHEFVHAAAHGDATAATKLLDRDFTWTDADGKTVAASEIGHSLPTPVLGNEGGVDTKERSYGSVAAVIANRGQVYVLRLWVKRAVGWRILAYHEVKQLDQPSNVAGTGVKECENPCKMVPFKPANEAEQAIIESWQALETGVTTHDSAAWAPHIADEFVQISSNSNRAISKADRMATLDKQKQSGVGSAPSPLVSAQMFDFGDAVVMTCLHQPYTGKAVHVSRLWTKRDGKWIMSISFQTTIQAATAKTS
jgi:hypothetical protein